MAEIINRDGVQRRRTKRRHLTIISGVGGSRPAKHRSEPPPRQGVQQIELLARQVEGPPVEPGLAPEYDTVREDGPLGRRGLRGGPVAIPGMAPRQESSAEATITTEPNGPETAEGGEEIPF